jgi:hypothetical protein
LGPVFLAYLSPFRLTPPRLIARDIVYAIQLPIFAGMGYLRIGNVNFGLLGSLLMSSVATLIVGPMFTARPPRALLDGEPALVLLSMGVKLWWSVSG